MDHPVEPPTISSVFPNPPPLYKSFTPANIKAVEALRNAHRARTLPSADTPFATAPPTPHLPNLPRHLADLQPPEEPANGRWRVCGDQYSLEDRLPSLEDQNIERLVPQGGNGDVDRDGNHLDRAFELKKLSKSVLLNFLELTGIMSRGPAGASEKVNDISTIFINMHHIMNEYRPHQARESAIAMLQDRLDQTRAETANIRSKTEMARQALEGPGSLCAPKPFRSVFASTEDEACEAERQRTRMVEAIWNALDEI